MDKQSRYLIGFLAAPVAPSLIAAVCFKNLMVLGFGLMYGYMIYLFAWPLFLFLISRKHISFIKILITSIILSVFPMTLFSYLDAYDLDSIFRTILIFSFFGMIAAITFWSIVRCNLNSSR